MEHNEILDFFCDDETIYKRGMAYYKENHVLQFEKKDCKINAIVQGSRQYNVHIKLDKSENESLDWDATCNCPYFETAFICKHIAAVLIYNAEKNKIVENPIITDKEKFNNDTIIKIDKGLKNQFNSFDCANYIENVTLEKVKNDANQSFKTIFIIEYSDDYYYKNQWTISPALQYLKRDGSGGRIEKFKEYKSFKTPLENEKILLCRLKNKPDAKDDLINHIDFLIKNNLQSLYLRNGKYSLPVQVSFKEIKKINIKFELKYNQIYSFDFEPVMDIIDKNDVISKGIKCFSIIYNGFSIFVITKEGKILYKENHKLYYALFRLISVKENKFTSYEIEKLKEYFQVKYTDEISITFNLKSIKVISPVPKPFIEIEQKYSYLNIELLFDYSGKEIPFKSEEYFISSGEKDNEYIVVERNRNYERKILNYFSDQIKFLDLDTDTYSFNSFTVYIPLTNFLAKHGLQIINNGIEIRIKGNKHKISTRRGNISINISSGIDWFDINLEYVDDEGERDKIILDMYLLKDGLIGVGETYTIIKKEEIRKLQLLLNEGIGLDGNLRVSKYNFHIIDELYEDIRNKQDPEIQAIKKISEKLKNFNTIEDYKPSKFFNGVLRDYQHSGYNWLHFLNKYNLNGCLADDMGLGKTVQTLAFLQRLKEEKRIGTILVVVPVTTISNWGAEIDRFTPKIKYLLHFGQSRQKDIKYLKSYDVIVVSYHTLRNDIELFNKIDYNYIILDESQNVKNYNSLAFKAVRTLKSNHRLSLTGTPIENNTLELWAQMDFLNPGLLSNVSEFKRKFAKPIEVYKDELATENLKKRIFPFILRRKKEDVAKELPTKSEIILYSEMNDDQLKIYEQYKEYYKAKVLGKIEEDGIEKSAIEIFTALLKLRQISLFPLLVDKKYNNISSCKFEQLKSLIKEILEEGHKILIFSQFIKPLEIIENYVKDNKIKYSYLDGSYSTDERKIEIKNFQEKEDIKLFLLSLRAGGTGINLTSADYVILFDPWWNPAVETQAIDRTHRIGQTRKVIAYKMIVKNTVEEKILELQEKKKTLVKEIITTETKFFKSLTKNDIVNLFK